MNKPFSILWIIILLVFPVFMMHGQENIDFVKKNFKNNNSGFRKALNNFETGNEYYAQKEYDIALSYYIQAYEFNPLNARLNYNIGDCYLESHPKTKALEYFRNANEINPRVMPDLAYKTGLAYQLHYEFDKAGESFKSYLNSLSPEEKKQWQATITKKLEECKEGKKLLLYPVNVDIVNLGNTINTEFPEYKPFLLPKENVMMVTSKREKIQQNQENASTKKGSEDIFVSLYKEGNWKLNKYLTNQLNTTFNDAIAGVSPDGKTFIFYTDEKGNGDLYLRKYNENEGIWGNPEYLPTPINSEYRETSASFSLTGDTLFFTSDNPAYSMGGTDILYAVKNSQNWQEVKNMGTTINSQYDEENVLYDPYLSIMYFSSNGHNTMGGMDIFYSMKDKKKQEWSKAKNIGFPVNSPEDDFYFSVFNNDKTAYISSVKENSLGYDDIYLVTFHESIAELGTLDEENLELDDLTIDAVDSVDKSYLLHDNVNINKQNKNTIDLGDESLDLNTELTEVTEENTNLKPFEISIKMVAPDSSEITKNSPVNFTPDNIDEYKISLPSHLNYVIEVLVKEEEENSEEVNLPKTE